MVHINTNGIYFLSHSIVNFVIVYLTYQDTIITIKQPSMSMSLPYSNLPNYIQLAFHTIHCLVDYKNLSLTDWLHHLLSSMLIGGITTIYTYGPLLNYAMFFINGLPGGIDYMLLFLVKQNYIAKITEKYINRYLNMYIRLPGLMLWLGISWVCYCDKKFLMPFWVLFLHFIFIGGNAIYFADKVVFNLGVHMGKLEKKL